MTECLPVKSSNWCFFSRPERRFQLRSDANNTAPLSLAENHAMALARLIPLLGCGEEAAALAFDGLSRTADNDGPAARALDVIAAEEREHGVLMQALSAALPPVTGQAALLRAARKFHICLGKGGFDLHLARIAALDAAVCTILSRLLRKGAPLSHDKTVYTTLSRIRRDEARHVALSRTLALASGEVGRACDVGAAARESLAKIMLQEGGAFERLGVDPDALERDLSRLPNGLLVA